MTETEKEEKNKAAYLDLPNFWLTSRPWLMLAFIGAFIFCQLLVFKHGIPESTLETLISAQGTFFFSVLIAAVGLIARASEILCPWDNRSPPNGCIQ